MCECSRFFSSQYLPRDVVNVNYYHENKAAKKAAHAMAKAHRAVVKVKPDVYSGDPRRNSWEIMEEKGMFLGKGRS